MSESSLNRNQCRPEIEKKKKEEGDVWCCEEWSSSMGSACQVVDCFVDFVVDVVGLGVSCILIDQQWTGLEGQD